MDTAYPTDKKCKTEYVNNWKKCVTMKTKSCQQQ